MSVRLSTTDEVAERFRTNPATVRYWRHIGAGPNGVRVGRRVLYDELECDRWYAAKISSEREAAADAELNHLSPQPVRKKSAKRSRSPNHVQRRST